MRRLVALFVGSNREFQEALGLRRSLPVAQALRVKFDRGMRVFGVEKRKKIIQKV